MLNDEIKVSICVVCFNQEQYITECLNSLVKQKTDFKFEIIVSDDCSTDNTPNIIMDFYKRYPHIIVPYLHNKNIGAFANFKFVHEQARGKYIAHLDGDDYALPNKLQIQADFLDANKNCNIVFHPMNIIDNKGNLTVTKISKKIFNYQFNRGDIIEFISIGGHSSKMYRSKISSNILLDFQAVDYTMNVLHVGNGYACYCSEIPLGVYRKGIGISGSDSVNLAVIRSLEYFLDEFPIYKREINSSSWGWFLNNLKYNKPTKWHYFNIILKSFSFKGLISYIKSRNFRRELSGL